MKYYRSYMDRQEISQETHARLLELEPPKRSARRELWTNLAALAACCALIVGLWKWGDLRLSRNRGVTLENVQAVDRSTPAAEDRPLQTDASVQGDWESGFVVSDSGTKDKLAFPMIPFILYQDRTSAPETAFSRAFAPGAFTVDLSKEDIQTIFWGPAGKPESDHPKTEQGDLPWMLFWDGYFVHGLAWYDNQGQLTEMTIYGEKDRASFELELRLGDLPFTCCVDMNRGDEISEFNGVEVAGWSKVYDRDGDGLTDYICGSEFMTGNDIGVRFVNRNSLMQAEYEEGENMDLGGAETFNSLFVRQALTDGLHLDHLMTAEHVPAWREESFTTLAQAREEAEFAPYLPTKEPEGYNEFYGRLSYQEGTQDMLFVRWSRVGAYDDVEVTVYRDHYTYNLVDPADTVRYDLRLYPVPWSESVPDEYWETVNAPAFRAEDMSLSVVEARGREHDTGGMTYSFDVLHPDGTVVSYRCDGLTAQQVLEMVAETL